MVLLDWLVYLFVCLFKRNEIYRKAVLVFYSLPLGWHHFILGENPKQSNVRTRRSNLNPPIFAISLQAVFAAISPAAFSDGHNRRTCYMIDFRNAQTQPNIRHFHEPIKAPVISLGHKSLNISYKFMVTNYEVSGVGWGWGWVLGRG